MNRDNRGKREPRDNRGRSDYRPARNDDRNRENRETRIPEEEKTPSADRLEGRNSVLEALKAGREINKIWVLDTAGKPDPILSRILDGAQKKKIPVVRTKREALDRMSETHNHQGVIAAVASHEYVSIVDMIAKVTGEGRYPFFVVLDELKDAYNLGSICLFLLHLADDIS